MALKINQQKQAPAAVELHIEELVLQGFRAGDRYRIGEALQTELARLLSLQGLPVPSAKKLAIERLDAGSFRVKTGARPEALGTQVAQKVHRGLTQPPKSGI